MPIVFVEGLLEFPTLNDPRIDKRLLFERWFDGLRARLSQVSPIDDSRIETLIFPYPRTREESSATGYDKAVQRIGIMIRLVLPDQRAETAVQVQEQASIVRQSTDGHVTEIRTTLEPLISCRHGRVWQCPLDPSPANPAWTATVSVWLLQIPRVHPAWDCFMLSVVHLRDIPDTPPATKQFPEATHELLLFALDPSVSPVDPTHCADFRRLTPINYVGQVQLDTDDQAVTLADRVARACLHQALPVELGGIMGARQFWDQSLEVTALHLRTGCNPGDIAEAPDREN